MSALSADNTAAQVGVTVTLSILIVTDLIGNSLVILIILTNKSMKSPMNYLLVNLAVADIMVGLFLAPRFVFSHFFTHPNGRVGTLVCKFLTGGNFTWLGAFVSVTSLMAVSFERYCAVIHPMSTRWKLRMQNVRRIIAVCWGLALLMNMPLFFTVLYDKEVQACKEKWPEQHHWLARAYSTVTFCFTAAIPITIMVVLYSRVIYTLWFKRSEHQVQGTQLAMLKSRKRVTKMLLIVSVIYAVCWLPDSVVYVLYHFDIENTNYAMDVPSICGIVLIACNSAINPFIYTFQSQEFRRHLKRLVFFRTFRRNRVSIEMDKDYLETAPKSHSEFERNQRAEND